MLSSLTFLMLTLIMYSIEETLIFEWNMFTIGSSIVSFPLLIDKYSTLFIFTVSYISANVLTFSKVYMSSDVNISRFTHLVMSFISSMFFLILCPNTITMLLGWDGLGITSFLLVIFYHNPSSLKSGMITLMTNRLGDCLILISIALIMSQGQWNMMFIWLDSVQYKYMLCMMIMVAATTKSAQFPFMAWLTCAMAAPTPVSALVHSSTLVTAGVYILTRFYQFLSSFDMFNKILLTSGVITMFLSASWAATKKDMKETIALSTMSQLGLMMSTLALGMVNLCFFHMITHAMFKATMFMAAGMVITFKDHHQTFTNMKMSLHSQSTSMALQVSLLSMNALYFTAGYYSKDIILELTWFTPAALPITLLFMLSTSLTAFYSARIWTSATSSKLYKRSFFKKNFPHKNLKAHVMNNKFLVIEIPMLLMSIMAWGIGTSLTWIEMKSPDFPIVTSMLQTLAPLMVLMGLLMHSTLSPSIKTKPTKNITNFNLGLIKKNYNQLPTDYMTNTQVLSTAHLTKSAKQLNALKTMLTQGRKAKNYVKLTYFLSSPVTKLSKHIETYIEMGVLMTFPWTLVNLSQGGTTHVISKTTGSISKMLFTIFTFVTLFAMFMMF